MGDSVKLSIISGFDPKGFRDCHASVLKLGSDVQTVSAGMQAAGTSMSGLAGSAGQLKTAARSAGQLANAIGVDSGSVVMQARQGASAIKGLCSLGPWGIAAAGAMMLGTAVYGVYKHLHASQKKLDEVALKMREAFHAGLVKAFESSLVSSRREYEKINKQLDMAVSRMDRLAAANDKLNKSAGGLASAQNSDAVKNIEAGYSTQKNAFKDSPEDLAVISALEKLDIIRQTNKESVDAANMSVTDSARELAQEKERVAVARERGRIAKEQLGIAQGEGARIPPGKQWDKAREENAAQVQTAQDDIAKAATEVAAGSKNVASAEFDLQTSTIKLHTARTAAAMTETECVNAVNALYEAYDDRIALSEKIKTQEDILQTAEANYATAVDKAAKRVAAMDQGEVGYHAGREAARDKAVSMAESNAKEGRWAENASNKEAAGTRLSQRDQRRLNDDRVWGGLRNNNTFDPAKNAQAQLAAAKEQLAETKKLLAGIESLVKVK